MIYTVSYRIDALLSIFGIRSRCAAKKKTANSKCNLPLQEMSKLCKKFVIKYKLELSSAGNVQLCVFGVRAHKKKKCRLRLCVISLPAKILFCVLYFIFIGCVYFIYIFSVHDVIHIWVYRF